MISIQLAGTVVTSHGIKKLENSWDCLARMSLQSFAHTGKAEPGYTASAASSPRRHIALQGPGLWAGVWAQSCTLTGYSSCRCFHSFFLKCLQNVEKCSRSRKTGTVQCSYSEHPLSTAKPTIIKPLPRKCCKLSNRIVRDIEHFHRFHPLLRWF